MAQRLSELDKAKFCGFVCCGNDRQTAARYFGLTLEELQQEMRHDEAFARQILQDEARAELFHMSGVYRAAKEENNWRTSVWWLERRAHQQREASTTERDYVSQLVSTMLARFAAVAVKEIGDLHQRQAVLAKLLEIAAGGGDAGDEVNGEPA